MAMNWARGLDELGTGLLRQADIGNKAYEGAMVKEGETRAENRLLAAEGRATKRQQDAWDREDKLLKEGREYEDRTFADRLKLTGEADMNIYVRKFGMESARQWSMKRYETNVAIRVAKEAAKSAEAIARIAAQAKRLSQLSDQIENLHEHRPDDAIWEDGKWKDDGVWKDEVDAKERAYRKAAQGLGLEPLTESVETYKYGPNASFIYDKVRGEHEGDAWKDLMVAMSGDKTSKSYEKALATVTEEVKKYIEAPNSPYSQMTGAERFKLRKATVDLFTREGHGYVADDLGDQEVAEVSTRPADAPIKSGLEVKGFWEDPAFLVQNLEKEADLDAVLQVGALAAAEATEQPERPGRAGGKKVAAIASAKKRDPEYILDILEKARYSYPQFGPRIEVLITKLKALIDKQKNLRPSPPELTGDPELTGLLNRPGMIQMFSGDPELDYSAEAVRARTEGMARPEELA